MAGKPGMIDAVGSSPRPARKKVRVEVSDADIRLLRSVRLMRLRCDACMRIVETIYPAELVPFRDGPGLDWDPAQTVEDAWHAPAGTRVFARLDRMSKRMKTPIPEGLGRRVFECRHHPRVRRWEYRTDNFRGMVLRALRAGMREIDLR